MMMMIETGNTVLQGLFFAFFWLIWPGKRSRFFMFVSVTISSSIFLNPIFDRHRFWSIQIRSKSNRINDDVTIFSIFLLLISLDGYFLVFFRCCCCKVEFDTISQCLKGLYESIVFNQKFFFAFANLSFI